MTAEESTHYHLRDSVGWRQVHERRDIEADFSGAIARHLAR